MKARIAKMRTLQKAGFVHVAGWLRAQDAAPVLAKIEATKPDVDTTLEASVTARD
jgi:hypothetical protein